MLCVQKKTEEKEKEDTTVGEKAMKEKEKREHL